MFPLFSFTVKSGGFFEKSGFSRGVENEYGLWTWSFILTWTNGRFGDYVKESLLMWIEKLLMILIQELHTWVEFDHLGERSREKDCR